MAAQNLGPGERIARRNRRRMYLFYTVCILLGGVLGGALGFFHQHTSADIDDWSQLRLPPTVAVLLAIGFLIALIGVPLYCFRLVDEVAVQRNLKAGTGATLAVLGGYPAWWALASGGLAPQPTALGIFLITYASVAILSLIFKFRG